MGRVGFGSRNNTFDWRDELPKSKSSLFESFSADETSTWVVRTLDDEGNPHGSGKLYQGKWRDVFAYIVESPGFWFYHHPAEVKYASITVVGPNGAEEIQKLKAEKAIIEARLAADTKRLADLKAKML